MGSIIRKKMGAILAVVNDKPEYPLEIEKMAAELECLLPKLMRRLFTLDPNHPVAELPIAQLRVCTILQGGSKSMTILSDELAISMSAMTQIADRLEKSGLVERFGEADDRRIKLLRLSEGGARMMRDRRASRIEQVAATLSDIDPETRDEFIKSIRIMLQTSEIRNVERLPVDPIAARQELA
ncbi:MAG: MarR family transcriptional regulator [Chthonomonadales bacterium]